VFGGITLLFYGAAEVPLLSPANGVLQQASTLARTKTAGPSQNLLRGVNFLLW
jgi:hypothetical protein